MVSFSTANDDFQYYNWKLMKSLALLLSKNGFLTNNRIIVPFLQNLLLLFTYLASFFDGCFYLYDLTYAVL